MVMGAPTGKILVIKLAALGDFVQALGPFAAIRAHHPKAHLVLLTTRPYQELAQATGLFDDIWLDSRPRGINLAGWFKLRQRLRGGRFERVYDLQTSDRSSFYFRLLSPGPKPDWSGIARGCSHPHANPARDALHTIDRQAEQLKMAGIENVPKPETTLTGAAFEPADEAFLGQLGITAPFALLVPGGAAHRPEKRWPTAHFAGLANRLLTDGIQPVLLGGESERQTLADIVRACPGAVDLAGRTGLADLVRLARAARSAVGNDTGPAHLIATAGCPSLVLYSAANAGQW
jgi:ADP-heptose:LPS heptosyltransferase